MYSVLSSYRDLLARHSLVRLLAGHHTTYETLRASVYLLRADSRTGKNFPSIGPYAPPAVSYSGGSQVLTCEADNLE